MRGPRRPATNVKAANIKLYTVRVIDGNATLLQDCATKPDMYYDVQNATQLNGVFSVDRAEPREPAHREVALPAAVQSATARPASPCYV